MSAGSYIYAKWYLTTVHHIQQSKLQQISAQVQKNLLFFVKPAFASMFLK